MVEIEPKPFLYLVINSAMTYEMLAIIFSFYPGNNWPNIYKFGGIGTNKLSLI